LKVEELENTCAEPGFWDDMENSQKVLQKVKGLKSKVERFEYIETLRDDMEVSIELGDAEEDLGLLEEVTQGVQVLEEKITAFSLELMLSGEYDANNAILTLHAGAGGTEAQDWVQMLYRMYVRWAEAKGFEVTEVDYLAGDEAGIKSVSFMVTGENAYGYLKAEKGVHRLVRISPFDSSGRRHTSFASLDVMPELDDDVEIKISPDDLKVDAFRASGAGGQHINKTSSAIRITHIPTGIVVSCQTERSQFQNKDTAMKMLYAKLMEIKERENLEKIEDIKGDQLEIAWGSQIRSYVFCPYTMVKDHRTGHKEGDVSAVMDGKIDGFIFSFLSGEKAEEDMNI